MSHLQLTIAAPSDKVVVIAAGESGGSWEMGQLCLKKEKSLFVLELTPDVASGNRRLIRAGAQPFAPDDFANVLHHVPPETQATLF